MSEGVVELIRDERMRIVRRIRHRRTSGNSQWMRIACSERGEGIAFPFDGDGELCTDCWGGEDRP